MLSRKGSYPIKKGESLIRFDGSFVSIVTHSLELERVGKKVGDRVGERLGLEVTGVGGIDGDADEMVGSDVAGEGGCVLEEGAIVVNEGAHVYPGMEGEREGDS